MVGLARGDPRKDWLCEGLPGLPVDESRCGATGRGNPRSREILLFGTPAPQRMDWQFTERRADQSRGAGGRKAAGGGEITGSRGKCTCNSGGYWGRGVLWLGEMLAAGTICRVGQLASGSQRCRSHTVWGRRGGCCV